MRKLPLLVTIILLAFLSHCKKDGNKDVKEIVIDEKAIRLNLALEKVSSVKLPGIRFPNLSHDGAHVYAYGYSTIKGQQGVILRKYDGQLNVLSENMFPIGQGPADVGGGVHFYPGGDFIYAPDNTQARVNIFDKNFEFVKFVNLQGYLPITMIKDGRYFLGTHWGINRSDGKDIYSVELVSFPQLKKTKLYTLEPRTAINSQKKFVFGKSSEFSYFYRNYKNTDRIYFVDMITYRVIVFDFNGNIIKNVRLNVEMKRVPPEMKNKWLREQASRQMVNRSKLTDWIHPVAKMVPLEKGFVVIRRKDYMSECSGMVEGDYFNFDAELQGKVQFPCYFRINKLRRGYITRTAMSFGGHLYLANEINEEYFLEKWRLSE
jgi:hypothetical protein